jgi:hypothetical protein
MNGKSRQKDVIAGAAEMRTPRHTFTRVVLTDRTETSSRFALPLNGSPSLVSFKALLRRSSNFYSVKVGVFGSQGRIGQGIQAVGTGVIPGDTSGLRSPIRSGVFTALTPGGLLPSGGVSASRESRGYRCPEGFQYGGRFTDNRFSTCGQMLFDIFPLGAALGQLLKPIKAPLTAAGTGGSVSPIPGLSAQDQQIVISRAAQIPKIGAENPAKKKLALDSARTALGTAEDGVTLLVRRDGFALRPVVPTSILRTVPDNRNMEGATFLVSAKSSKSLGGEELGMLSNTGISELNYLGNSGTMLSLRKTRPLTVGERRRLGRLVAKVAGTESETDPAIKLRQVAENSNGAIEYREDFGSINDPNDIISVVVGGSKKQIRRWVYENFVRQNTRKKPAAVLEETPTTEPVAGNKITSLSQAIKHLDTGGDPSKILASILPQALQRARGYSLRQEPRGAKLHSRRGSYKVREFSAQNDFEHLNAKVTSDIQRLMGLNPEPVIFEGGGRRQPYFSYEKLDADFSITAADNLDNLDPAQILALAMSDFILDNRSHTASTTRIVTIKGKKYIRSADNSLTLLAGISKSKNPSRMRMFADEAMNASAREMYRKYFAELTEQQRRLVLMQLDRILSRLTEFSWDEYLQRLNIDGKLSTSEKTHLNIVRSIIDTRVKALKASKKSFADLLF